MRRPMPGPCAARAGQRRRRRFQSAHALLGRVVASRQAIRSASRLRVAMVAAGCDHAVSRPAPSWRSRFRSSSPKPLGRVDPHVEPRGVPVFMFQEGVTRLRRMPTARSRGSHVAHIAGSIPAQPTSSGELLRAVAAYASGGLKALDRLSADKNRGAIRRLEQMR